MFYIWLPFAYHKSSPNIRDLSAKATNVECLEISCEMAKYVTAYQNVWSQYFNQSPCINDWTHLLDKFMKV